MTQPTLTFAQAQQRVVARRQARHLDAAAAHQHHASPTSTYLRRLPYPLSRLTAIWHALSAHDDGTARRPAFRVAQVDAQLLDDELLDLLTAQVASGLRYFADGHLHDDWSDEITLFLRALLFKLTVWDHDATYGAALQNLQYTDARCPGPVLAPPSRVQKSLYGLFSVVGRYAWRKWEDWLAREQDDHDHDDDDDDDDKGPGRLRRRVEMLARWTARLTTLHAAGAAVSFLVFLLRGRYRTLLDRLLRMRLAAPTSQISREVSFEYLNRQLVWHAFTEFLLFVLPLIGINRWRRWLSRTWRKTKELVSSSDGSGSGSRSSGGEYGFLPERTCAICYHDQNEATTENEIVAVVSASSGMVGSAQTDVTNPYEAIPCGCVYCFVCLATRLEREEGEGITCLRCGGHVKECQPWSADVLEPTGSRPGVAKTVAFSDDVRGGMEDVEK